MGARTEGMAGALRNVAAGLLALPLADLPDIASVQLHTDVDARRIMLQLSSGTAGEQVASLLAWADVLPEVRAFGSEHDDYIRLEVAGVLGGLCVAVWTHIRGEHLVDTGCFLGLPLVCEAHGLPLGVLRALAQHRAVSVDA